MAFPQFVDIAVYQPSDESYFKKLRRNGACGTFIQLNYGLGYKNPKAPAQIRNSIKYLDFTGCYAFFLGNPVAEAKEFLAYLHYYGMDRTTPVMLDVEANEAYNGPQTALINKWTDIVYRDGYHNIYIYSMGSWLNDGYHIKPENLKHGKIWAAAYDTTQPGVVNASAWQYTDNWHYMHTDGDYLFLPENAMTGQGRRPKPKAKPRPKAKPKPKNTYLKKGHKFMVTSNISYGYNDLNFKSKNGTHLTKGSVVKGRIMPCGKVVTRILTGSGYFSANTKYMKNVG